MYGTDDILPLPFPTNLTSDQKGADHVIPMQYCPHTNLRLRHCDSLTAISCTRSISVGERVIDSNDIALAPSFPHHRDLEMVACAGGGKEGKMVVLQKNIRPVISSSFDIADVLDMWTVKTGSGIISVENSPTHHELEHYHKFLILSKSDSTMVISAVIPSILFYISFYLYSNECPISIGVCPTFHCWSPFYIRVNLFNFFFFLLSRFVRFWKRGRNCKKWIQQIFLPRDPPLQLDLFWEVMPLCKFMRMECYF